MTGRAIARRRWRLLRAGLRRERSFVRGTNAPSPLIGVGGFGTPPDGLFGAFQKVLKERGILFISDEMQTGRGRTGAHFWGYEAHGGRSDVKTFAKGVGNGLALGGVVASADIMNCLKASSLPTFGCNRLATRGALATLRFHRRNNLQRNPLERGRELRTDLDRMAAQCSSIGEARGRGRRRPTPQ